MFVKPIDAATLPSSTWQDRAGNTHFTLQSKVKENAVRSLFSGLTSISVSGVDAAYKKSLGEYDFRILLRLASKKISYVVGVESTFEKIHADWNWVENNLFLKLAEIDVRNISSKTPNITVEQTDNLLLKQFEEMTEEYGDPQGTAAQAKLVEVASTISSLFVTSQDDLILNFYACTYWASETASARGQLCIGRNSIYFFGSRQPGSSDPEEVLPVKVAIHVAYKDVLSLELLNAKRVLVPDSIQVGVKDKNYTFSLYFSRKEVFRIMCCLCNAAMNRLIKGAENSLSASSEMFSKNSSNQTGDLAITTTNRGGGLVMGRSREDYGMERLMDNGGDLGSAIEEFDVGTAMAADLPDIENTISKELDMTRRVSVTPSQSVVRYSHIKTSHVTSLADVDDQNRNLEFRNVFRLSYHETITLLENPVYLFQKSTSTLLQGYLYLSQNFLSFACINPGPHSNPSLNTSMLFDSTGDPAVLLVIPYPHIVSVKKQPPTALPSAGKISAFSLSGYLVVSTKNRLEFWLSFANVKARDKVSDALLSQIKTVDWTFDDDVVIGSRVAFQRARKVDTETPSISMANRTLGQEDRKEAMDILVVGLKFLMDVNPREVRPSGEDQAVALISWSEYFDSNGRDVCLIKDLKPIRDLIVKTGGVPDEFRGDFWMLVSGAWYSKPEKGYYRNLLVSNSKKANPFALEIEKDVTRSLPEHPAYQDARGIDALRRVLTAFSWRNPAIGYAQALNIIAAVLLLHIGEEDAFWMLCIQSLKIGVIVERMLPDHYTKTLVGSVVDQSVFTQLVSLHLPNLAAHLNKLYMDLSTFSVPWFLCLFLNSVSLSVGIRFLDSFFLDGPKFLFWVAVGVLKVNESKLIAKGKDDDIFVAVLKDFFTRLGLPPDSDEKNGGADPINALDTITGRPLYTILMTTVYTTLAPIITNESIETLRMRYRLKVVHQMEENNRKSQVRTLCEQVTLSFDEVACVYDEIRRLEFIHGEEDEDPNGSGSKVAKKGREEEETMRFILASLGGWGLVSKSHFKPNQTQEPNPYEKTISLADVRKVLPIVGPWASPHDNTQEPSLVRKPSSTDVQPSAEDLNLSLVDRIYHYCSFQYHFVQRQKKQSDSGIGGQVLMARMDAAGLTGQEGAQIGFNVDLAAIVHVLEAFMKQPIHARIRFLFDLHDLDGDGFLSKVELKAVMDSFLQMFEKEKPRDGKKAKGSYGRGDLDEEAHLRAVSSFLNAALKTGQKTGVETKPRPLSSIQSGVESGMSAMGMGEEDDEMTSRSKSGSLKPAHQRSGTASTESQTFKLTFNEFLLCVLSQNEFVQYFERTWKISRDSSGDVQVFWQAKG